jgi:hypothetical protein
MNMRDLRAEARIAVKTTGLLNTGLEAAGHPWFPCVIHDMSDSGFLIRCSQQLQVGQTLDFQCQLFPGKTLSCMIEIRHISPAGIGTMITEIDEKGTKLVQLYLQEQYSLRMSKAN